MSLPVYPERYERLTMSELFRDLVHKIRDYNKAQMKLVQAQIKVESQKLATVMLFGFAALGIGVIMLLFLGISLLLLLSKAVDPAWAAVITTAFFLALAGISVAMMLKALRKDSSAINIEQVK